ncbi:cytochrome P450 11B2 [Chaetomium fimeti]|uniref:Cytochrome P450 11B2 n=1 Tax=Chaetomium fimeti TaxID=1854472 RepID=A0AAE0LQW2_9PEZI|nr:cytochrome P450 11B2 [Chaetomium fimeti]
MAFLIASIAIVAIGASIVWSLATRIRNWYRLRHIPGPPGAGWTKFFLVRHQFSGKLPQHLRNVAQKHGPIARIAPNWVLVSSPPEMRRIWSIRSAYRRSSWYAGFRIDPNRDSIISMVGNKSHLRLRSRLVPAYQARGITDQEEVLDGQVGRFVDFLGERVVDKGGMDGKGRGVFEMGRGFSYFTQDAISAVAFGRSFGYLEKGEDWFGAIAALEGMLLPCSMMGLLPGLLAVVTSPLCKPLMPKKTDQGGVGRLLGVIGERVSERYGEKRVRNMDVLQVLVESGLSREEVESEALVHLLGGTDTTATALRNAVFFLSTCPKAYRKLQDEIDGAVGRVTRPVIADAECTQLRFLQACIQESIRCWPPLSGFQAKVSDVDDVICGVKVPAGTNIAFGFFEIMRDKGVFGDNAEVYDPMRWLEAGPEQLKEMEATQGLAFAAGSRWECLGRRLANMEMGKVIFELSLRFDFVMLDPVSPLKWEHQGFTVNKDMNVVITKREPKEGI